MASISALLGLAMTTALTMSSPASESAAPRALAFHLKGVSMAL